MLVTVLLVTVLAACGDDEGAEPGADGAASAPAQGQAEPAPSDDTAAAPRADTSADRRAGPEERQASEPVLRQFRAIEAGDARTACAQFSPAGRRAFERDFATLGEETGSCEDFILGLRVPALEVTGVALDGDRARVVLEGGLEYVLERVGGSWKLAG